MCRMRETGAHARLRGPMGPHSPQPMSSAGRYYPDDLGTVSLVERQFRSQAPVRTTIRLLSSTVLSTEAANERLDRLLIKAILVIVYAIDSWVVECSGRMTGWRLSFVGMNSPDHSLLKDTDPAASSVARVSAEARLSLPPYKHLWRPGLACSTCRDISRSP